MGTGASNPVRAVTAALLSPCRVPRLSPDRCDGNRTRDEGASVANCRTFLDRFLLTTIITFRLLLFSPTMCIPHSCVHIRRGCPKFPRVCLTAKTAKHRLSILFPNPSRNTTIVRPHFVPHCYGAVYLNPWFTQIFTETWVDSLYWSDPHSRPTSLVYSMSCVYHLTWSIYTTIVLYCKIYATPKNV